MELDLAVKWFIQGIPNAWYDWVGCKGKTSAEMCGKHLKEGSIPVYLVGASIAFQISRTKFL